MGKPDQFLGRVELGRQRIDVVEFMDLAKELGLDPTLSLSDLYAAVSRQGVIPR